MFEWFINDSAPAHASTAVQQVDSLLSANSDLDCLFPCLAGLPKGCAPRSNGLKVTPHPNHPHVEAHKILFYWVSEQSLAHHETLATRYSGDALANYDSTLHSLWSHGTLGGYGSALADWISWCNLMKIPETSHLPISKIDLCMYLAKKVSQDGTSKAKTIMSRLATWHVMQDVPWHGDDRLAIDFRKAIASKAPASKTCAACPPITTDHLKTHHKHLNLHSNPFDISMFTVACCAF
jgi:hypothetical protein